MYELPMISYMIIISDLYFKLLVVYIICNCYSYPINTDVICAMY